MGYSLHPKEQERPAMTRPPIKIVDNAKADEDDFVVCMRLSDHPYHFPDNKRGYCWQCGAIVVFRPNMPTKPKRICMQCAALAMTKPGGGA